MTASRQRWTLERGVIVDAWIEPAQRDEDRIGIVLDEDEGHISFVLADGAGNSGRGHAAADIAVSCAGADRDVDPVSRIHALDSLVARIGAEAAVVIAEVTCGERGLDIRGASGGDVRCWARRRGEWHELTEGTPRKPLVGSGACARGFAMRDLDEILCASDGLAAWAGPSMESIDLSALVDRARMPSGRIADDLSIVWIRLDR